VLRALPDDAAVWPRPDNPVAAAADRRPAG
jgi:hypothetical protein